MKKILSLVFTMFTLAVSAQKEANIWYFGNQAGLDFNSGSPVVLLNSAMTAFEGVSSISDAAGNLLFYTDGMTIWDNTHSTMLNGTGLGGNSSTTQSAFVVKQPGSATLYYIFTGDAQLAPNGFQYNIIDMSLNGGKGAVTVKNNMLYTPSTEKITGVTQANGFDVWVITHDYNNNNFQAYTLSASGFNTTPVISSVGPVINQMNDVIGYMKVSPNGSRIAMAMSNSNQFWMFDFNRVTGVVSNPIQLTSSGGVGSGAYGVEFSPNSNVLYGTVEGASPAPILYQWDLSSNNAVTINASRINLNPTLINAVYMGSLSLAPDGKIYFTRNTCDYLGAINDPNTVGTGCNMVDSAIFLQGKSCVYGLPNLNQSLYNAGFSVTGLCYGDSTFFHIDNTTGLFGAQWDFGDPASGVDNTSFLTDPTHLFTAPGTYQVTVLKFYAAYTDTVITPVIINPPPAVSLGPDTVLCSGSTYVINAGSGFDTYLWQDNSTDSIFSASLPGTYYVTVSQAGCEATDSVTITAGVCSVPNVSFVSSDTTFCDKKCLDFTDLSTNNPTSWQWLFPGATPASDTVQNPVNICYNAYGTFDVTLIACNAAGCDTLHVPAFITEFQLPPQPVITQSNDTLYCSAANSYSWYNTTNPGVVISTNSYYTTSSGGSYFVIVGDSNGCQNSSPVFTATGIDNLLSAGHPVSVFPNPVNGQLHLYTSPDFLKPAMACTILDHLGQEVFQATIEKEETVVNLGNLANGIYYLRVGTGSMLYSTRFVVLHHP